MTEVIPTAILIDARNIDQLESELIAKMSSCTLFGFDIETQDVGAHEGIKTLRKEDEDGNKSAAGKSVFDWRRTVVTGASIYMDGDDCSYYFNLAHADELNRLPWDRLKKILDTRPADACIICHNAPFELTVMANSLDYDLTNVICTMQMAVSAYGPDEYERSLFIPAQFGEINQLLQEADQLFGQLASLSDDDDIEDDGEQVKSKKLNPKQQDLLNKVLGKSSKAAYSYNGLVSELAYGYGLKKAVKSFFGHQMTTYEETLRGRNHMGDLTGEEVFEYGADDSYWAVRLFYRLYAFMENHCPNAIPTFFEQENPMVYVFSQVRREGMKVNRDKIEERRGIERATFAKTLREMKACIREMLPFPTEPEDRLFKFEKWYGGEPNHPKGPKPPKFNELRQRIADWANSPDSDDDFLMACQVSSPVSNAWAGKKCPGLSIGHYYQARLLMYDLARVPAIVYKGKIASDADCRGEVLDKIKTLRETCDVASDAHGVNHYKNAEKLIKLMGELASVEQRMKLYLTPYLLLTDPETVRMYPEVTSMLATRRMAASNPNPMQLAKRGESTYIRGFYEADEKKEVIVSLDWSQVELVLIGEFSGDPEFKKAFGQLPYNDLHLGAAADVLSMLIPEVTEEMLKGMHKMEASQLPDKLLVKPNGELLTPASAKKFWRTEVGKGSNFNYWYSGALSTVGEKLGWTSDQMWKATERYRERFAVAEAWRVGLIEHAREYGFIELPDGHRRYRWEATYEWQNIARQMFAQYGSEGIKKFGDEIIRATKTRAGNQIVNAMIQGSSATLAKRSILAINERAKVEKIPFRFKMPIHDELVFSGHRDAAIDFIHMAKDVMANHPSIVKDLKLYSTASIGLNFEPFDLKKAPLGQIELDEAPEFLGFGDGVVLNDEQIAHTINYLFETRDGKEQRN